MSTEEMHPHIATLLNVSADIQHALKANELNAVDVLNVVAFVSGRLTSTALEAKLDEYAKEQPLQEGAKQIALRFLSPSIVRVAQDDDGRLMVVGTNAHAPEPARDADIPKKKPHRIHGKQGRRGRKWQSTRI